MEPSNFQAKKQLLIDERSKGFARLRFSGKKLEKEFNEYFTNLSRESLVTSFLFLIVPLFILAHVISYDIGFDEFLSTFLNTLLALATFKIPTFGMEGAFACKLIALLLIILLIPASKIGFFKNNFQLCLSISLSLILGIALSALFMIDDERYRFIFNMLLMSGFLCIYFLIFFQFIYVLLYQFVCILLLFSLSTSLNWHTNWVEFSILFGSISIFGLIFAYLREIRERGKFLSVLEIETQKQEYEFLHKQIEKENLLKEKLAALHSAMSGEKNLKPLAEKILAFLVPRLDCSLASLYLCKDETLILLANFGTQDSSRTTIAFGETLLGQAAESKQVIQIDQSPEDFQTIRSGLGSIERPAIFIMPILFSDELVAVVEFASIQKMKPENVDLLEAASRSIATALRAVAAKSNI